ncbi:MAG: tol-pal system protein YbgF [Deltaproteobacteria bacterium]|nr:tol-pal system protein YbgF [Deltaproteobacteria bacterium]
MRRLIMVLLAGQLCFLVACKLPLDERPEVQRLQAENAKLAERVKALEDEQQTLRREVRDLQLKLAGVRDLAMKNSQQLAKAASRDRKIRREVKQAAKAAAKCRAGAKKPAADSEAMLTYREALEYYRNGRYEKSIDLFHAFIKAYPKNPLVGNARYWLGENHYSLSEFAQAVTEFKRLLKEYPRSQKVPDSLVKIGMSYQAIGIGEKARKYYQRVIDKFPQSPAAALARKKLKELAG